MPLIHKTRGLVILYTGNGKGKTTAALGLLLRAYGHDMKIIVLQFIKRPLPFNGEYQTGKKLGIELISGGAGFTNIAENALKNKDMSIHLWDMAYEKINCGYYDMVILDEFTYPLIYGWIDVDDVIYALKHRPEHVHVVITGRKAPEKLIEFADIATDMQEIKHCLSQGITAQPGIEY